jgi:hypothetical protein
MSGNRGEHRSIRVLFLLATTILANVILVTPTQAREQWTKAQAWSWFSDQPRLFGANYVMGYAATPTEMWQADPSVPGANTFDINRINFELDRAQATGFNTLRVTLSYEVWKADRNGFMNRLEQFLNASDARGIRPTFILWDDVNFTLDPNVPDRQPYLGRQADPVPGMHNSQWTGTGGNAVLQNHENWDLPRTNSAPGAGARQYVQDIISRYANDERVLMWNAYNEPANGGQSVANASRLIASTAQWARAMNPRQPISFDAWGSSADSTAIAESDVISYHNYSSPASTIAAVRNFVGSGRPVFLTEWMARTFGSTIPDILPDLQEMNVASYNWGLVNGDQQTHWPWGSPPQTQTSEPPLWFHDLYRRDGTPYIASEIQMYQHYRLQDQVLRSADSRYVTIQNPSFEADDLGGVPDAYVHRQFNGWNITRESGSWVGGTIVPDTWHFTEPVPQGSQAMFAVDIEVAQVLGETLQANTYYVLQVDVGHRVDRNLPDYDIDLFAGGVELTPLTAALSNPVEGQWTDAVKIYQASPSDSLLGLPLEIRLSSTGYETFFDNVRLIAVDSLAEIGATSDLNRDGEIDRADWALFIANAFADLSAYTPAQQFLHGDFDRDGDNDHDDFLIFKSDYTSAHGEAGFNALFNVPEPTGFTLVVLLLTAVLNKRRK